MMGFKVQAKPAGKAWVTISMSKALQAEVKEVADRANISLSDFCRQAIQYALNNMDEQP